MLISQVAFPQIVIKFMITQFRGCLYQTIIDGFVFILYFAALILQRINEVIHY